MPAFTLGEVAKAAGVGIETVRFYERKGLIPDPPRRPSGYRAYPEAVVDRIVFILDRAGRFGAGSRVQHRREGE